MTLLSARRSAPPVRHARATVGEWRCGQGPPAVPFSTAPRTDPEPHRTARVRSGGAHDYLPPQQTQPLASP